MGGLISLCGLIIIPDYFGSTASIRNWMWVRNYITPEKILKLIQGFPFTPGRIELDIGDLEYVDTLITGTDIHPDQLVMNTRKRRVLLTQKNMC